MFYSIMKGSEELKRFEANDAERDDTASQIAYEVSLEHKNQQIDLYKLIHPAGQKTAWKHLETFMRISHAEVAA